MARTPKLIPIERDQIPGFRNEDEEDAFWATHELGPGMLDEMRSSHDHDHLLPASRERAILRRNTRNLSIRFDLDTLARLRSLAKKKGIGYQTLLKQFVSERLYEEEKRERIID